jgi:replicative DNA helicase
VTFEFINTNGHIPDDVPTDKEQRDLNVPPHSEDAEQAVLGSVLKHPPSIRQIVDLVEAADFYNKRHQAIWAAMKAIADDDLPIDYHLLGDRLHTLGTYDVAGGLLYLSEINLATPSAAYIAHYAKIVVRQSMMRRLITLAQRLAEAAWKDDKEPEAIITEMERRLERLTARAVEDDGLSMADLMDAWCKRLGEEIDAFARWEPSRGEYVAGWRTGLRGLDNVLLGLKAGDLIYLAARTSVGKSILAEQIALAVANAKGLVYYASLEMSGFKLMDRAITMLTGIPRHELQRGNLSLKQRDMVDAAVGQVRELPIYWDISSRTVEQIHHRAERWAEQMQQPLALIVVDYVQLLRDQVSQRSNRYENVSMASHNLKDMAIKLDCTVLAPAQVSRQVLNRKSKMPDLSDLRESGDLEQDADLVLGLDRADYHDRDAQDRAAFLAILKARDLAGDRGRGVLVELEWWAEREHYTDPTMPNNVVKFRPTMLNDDIEAAKSDAPNGDAPLPW